MLNFPNKFLILIQIETDLQAFILGLWIRGIIQDFIINKIMEIQEEFKDSPESGTTLDKKDLEAITPSTTPFETGDGEF